MIRYLVLGLLLASTIAEANIGEAFGLGSRNAALAGAGVSGGFDAFAAYANPAGLPFAVPEGKAVNLGLNILYMDPEFTPIKGVYVQNKYVSDQTRIDDVDTHYEAAFGQSLGLVYQSASERRWTLGVTTFLPVNQVAYLDTGETYIPEYFMYRSRLQRPQVNIAVGADVSQKIHVGAGMYLAFSVNANGTLFLNSNPDKPSVMRFVSVLKPKASPYMGILLTPLERPEELSVGMVIRAPATSDVNMALNSGARLLSTLAALDFNFTAISALAYDPWTMELGTSWAPTSTFRLLGQLDYQIWNRFQSPALQIQKPDITSCDSGSGGCAAGFALSPGKNPTYPFRNIIIPRIAAEFMLFSTTFRLGYGYRPSMLSDVSNGVGNYLDPPQHMVSAGAGMEFKKLLGHEIPTRLDFHLAYHFLTTQHITKSPGDEGGDATDSKIGAPGYDAGGKVLGGGVSLSINI